MKPSRSDNFKIINQISETQLWFQKHRTIEHDKEALTKSSTKSNIFMDPKKKKSKLFDFGIVDYPICRFSRNEAKTLTFNLR